jgi:ubiquitin carboxyl-terminal hydrolase 22/27/51
VKKKEEVCLGCEMDKLFLKYFGSTIGVDVTAILAETAQDKEQGRSIFTDAEVTEIPKGQPLITADMLTAAWQCGGMDHLAGYAQRDAHEFLHGFLDVLGKNARQYRERMYKTIKSSVPGNAIITADKFTENGK